MLPTEEFIKEGEVSVGLEKDDFFISDSFEEFGFDSTDPIQNLQVMFIFMLFLIAYPILSLGLRGLCYCSRSFKRCLDWLNA